MALETPHSPKGLHVLARHSQSFASALLQFISSVTSPSTKAGTAAAAAAAAEVAAAVATAHRCLESMLARDNIFTLPPSQIVDILASPAFLFASAIGRTLINPTSAGHVTLTAIAPLLVSQCEAGSASGAYGPDGYSVQSGVQVGGVQWGLRHGAGVYVGCCSLIMAGLRHHAGAVRRCMALVGPSTRALLRTLMLWSQPQSSIRWLATVPFSFFFSVLHRSCVLFVSFTCEGKPCMQPVVICQTAFWHSTSGCCYSPQAKV